MYFLLIARFNGNTFKIAINTNKKFKLHSFTSFTEAMLNNYILTTISKSLLNSFTIRILECPNDKMSEELIFDKSLQNIKFIFRLSGLNIDHKKRTFKQNCIYLFNLLWHQTDLLSALSWVLCGMFTGKVFTELTFVAPCSVFGILADTKGVLFILQERKIYGLMNNLRDLEIKAKDFVGTRRDSLIKPDIYLLDIVIKVLNILNGLMIVVFDMCPPIFIAIKYFTTGQLELMLPFLDVYFFDGFDLRYWPFLYAHQVWSGK